MSEAITRTDQQLLVELFNGVGRLRTFTHLFQGVLRREFLHSPSALKDWSDKIRLLGGVGKAARELVRDYQMKSRAALSRPSHSDAFRRDGSQRLNKLNEYYLGLLQNFVNHSGSAIQVGREAVGSVADPHALSNDVLDALNQVLSHTGPLESTLLRWQLDLQKCVPDRLLGNLNAHSDIRIPVGWESHSVVEYALLQAQEALEQDDAVAICMQTRQLFLANYYHSALSPEQFQEQGEWAVHQPVVELHQRAIGRFNQLLECDSIYPLAIVEQCRHSAQWRLKQLQGRYNPRGFLEQAEEVPVYRSSPAECESALSPMRVRSDELRVLLFGPKRWQQRLEKVMYRHVSVVSGIEGLLRQNRNPRAKGFHLILVHDQFLIQSDRNDLKERFGNDHRVVVVVDNAHDNCQLNGLPDAWSWAVVADHLPDAHWLISHCIATPTSSSLEEKRHDTEMLVKFNRIESLVDISCQLIDQIVPRIIGKEQNVSRSKSIFYSVIKDRVAELDCLDRSLGRHGEPPWSVIEFLHKLVSAESDLSDAEFDSITEELEKGSWGGWLPIVWLHALTSRENDSPLERTADDVVQFVRLHLPQTNSLKPLIQCHKFTARTLTDTASEMVQ